MFGTSFKNKLLVRVDLLKNPTTLVVGVCQFDDKGKMQTGWQHIGDSWYFFNDTVDSGLEGAMYVSDKDGKQFIATFNN